MNVRAFIPVTGRAEGVSGVSTPRICAEVVDGVLVGAGLPRDTAIGVVVGAGVLITGAVTTIPEEKAGGGVGGVGVGEGVGDGAGGAGVGAGDGAGLGAGAGAGAGAGGGGGGAWTTC